MTTSKATARWNGTLKEGNGVMKYGEVEGPFTFASRFEKGKGTNPEELVGAAHSGCFSMYLAAIMSADNFTPISVQTTASVHLGEDDGPKITSIDLNCKQRCPAWMLINLLNMLKKPRRNAQFQDFSPVQK